MNECVICSEDAFAKCIYCNSDICTEHSHDHNCAKRIKNVCWKCKDRFVYDMSSPHKCEMCEFNFCHDHIKYYCERCDQLRMIKNNQRHIRLGQKLCNWIQRNGMCNEDVHIKLFHMSNEEFMEALNEDVEY